MKERDLTLDGIKFLLICLVVLCHFTQASRYDNQVTTSIYTWIYAFHMPLFVLLSGYFFKADSIEKINKSNLKILEPLVVYHSIFTAMRIRSLHDLTNIVVFEPSPMWYIVSLIMWRYIAFYINSVANRMGGGKKSIHATIGICISIVLMALVFITVNKYECIFSFMRTFMFLPFFLIGFYMTENTIASLRTKSSKVVFSIFGILAASLFIKYAGPKLCAIEFMKDGILGLQNKLETTLTATVLYKLLVLSGSLVISFASISLIHIPTKVAKYGQYTMFIFCTHVVLYPFMTYFVSNLWLGIVITVMYLVVALGIAQSKYSNYFLYPITTILKKNNLYA